MLFEEVLHKNIRVFDFRLILILHAAYPASFDDDYDESGIFEASEPKLTRPLSVPGSPRHRSGMMTPGDFASLQEGREGLSTEDYIAWKLPYVARFFRMM